MLTWRAQNDQNAPSNTKSVSKDDRKNADGKKEKGKKRKKKNEKIACVLLTLSLIREID